MHFTGCTIHEWILKGRKNYEEIGFMSNWMNDCFLSSASRLFCPFLSDLSFYQEPITFHFNTHKLIIRWSVYFYCLHFDLMADSIKNAPLWGERMKFFWTGSSEGKANTEVGWFYEDVWAQNGPILSFSSKYLPFCEEMFSSEKIINFYENLQNFKCLDVLKYLKTIENFVIYVY